MKKTILYICLLLCIAWPVYGQQVRLGYDQGFARSAGESANPSLWKGLVGAWVPLLGITGITPRDVSGYHNDGTLTNMDAATDWVIGENGYALNYAGDTFSQLVAVDSALVIDDLTSGKLTVCSGINAASGGENGTGRIAAKRHASDVPSGGWTFFMDATESIGFIAFDTGTDGSARGADNAISHGVYANVACVYDNTGDRIPRLYASGKEIGYQSQAAATGTARVDNGGELAIGGFPNTHAIREFDGDIEYTLIWNRILTDNEIAQIALDPLSLLRLRQPVFRAPDAAPARNRVHLISQYMNRLIEQCYLYN